MQAEVPATQQQQQERNMTSLSATYDESR
jgi:hypothetical protein